MNSGNELHELATKTLGECQDVLDQRGFTHGNTLGKLSTPYMDATLREMGVPPETFSMVQMKKLCLAAQLDVKQKRIEIGRAGLDSAIDFINYMAAWCQLDAAPKYDSL